MSQIDKPASHAPESDGAQKKLEELPAAAEGAPPRPEQPHPAPRLRRTGLLPNLLLAALLGCLLLLLGLWLSGSLSLSSLNSNLPTIFVSNAGPYTTGSLIRLQGQQFSHFALVALLRDGQPATDSNGQRLAVTTDQNGAFSITLVITSAWGAGDHTITALDTASQQRAAVTIHVESGTSYVLNSLPLASLDHLLASNWQQGKQITGQQPGITERFTGQ